MKLDEGIEDDVLKEEDKESDCAWNDNLNFFAGLNVELFVGIKFRLSELLADI